MPATVKERIEARLLELLQEIAGVDPDNAQRWSMQGNGPKPVGGAMPEIWVLLEAHDEIATDEETNGFTDCRMEVDLSVHLVQDEEEAESQSTAELANDWLGKLEDGLPLKAADNLEEAGGEQIAHRLRKTGSDSYGAAVKGQPETVATLSLEVFYRHPLGDPYSVA